jgi:hypothetical protein
MKAGASYHRFLEEVSSIHGQDYPEQISILVPLWPRTRVSNTVSISAAILADDA